MFFLFLALVVAVEGVCRNGNVVSSGLTCAQKKEILDTHNELRNLVASGKGIKLPSAQDMLEMRWSEQAAKTAQILADRCVFEHDTKIGGLKVGQNLAIYKSQGNVDLRQVLQKMMKGWIDEGEKYVAGQLLKGTGHYSQMIWGNSNYVGCGYTVYKEKGFDSRLLVCNYLPPGNVVGQQPYTYGNINCQKHGKVRSSKYTHLCAVDRKNLKVC